MTARGEVFLGDLVRAVGGLRPRNAATAAAMARLLGLDGATATGSRDPAEERAERLAPPPHVPAAPDPDDIAGGTRPVHPPRPVTARARPADTGHADGPGTAAPFGVREPAAHLTRRPVDFSLTALHGSAPTTVVPTAGDGPGAADPALLSPGTAGPALPHEPPWKPDWARGIMFAAVSTPVAGREPDERSLLRSVARQDAVRALPRRHRFSTRRGAQLLLDHGPALAPFQDDRLWLRELIGSVAGRDRVELLRFRGTPTRGVVRRDPLRTEEYRPPLPGTPVVLFSDLGLLRPPFTGRTVAPAGEWRHFLDLVARAGCPVVCLTPYRDADHPVELRDRVAFLSFDRRVCLKDAREAAHRARQRLERA
ncbi:hypothetical protein [Streptomyces sp. A012304]|uniref:hypothetical protein n=1 Tax=Streptomyces sp. A012304 TaxID=375446 RepID=UPI002232B3BD|nr:hypothetical protein [Streptomyces sp. A012304]GKQ38818.1 hypothetical protein ALMP_53470 [Streptomyces sp. A012304]